MSVLPPQLDRGPITEERPPFLKTWRRVYLAVVVWLAVLIVAFYLFARLFRG
jgi:hypothetical protein